MSTWADEYVEEMNELRFSDEEKWRIAERLKSSLAAAGADVIPFEGVADVTGVADAEAAAGEQGEQPDRAEKTDETHAKPERASAPAARPRRWRRRLAVARIAASVLLALAVAGVSAYAYASGALGVGIGVIGDIFTGAPVSTEVYSSVGYPIGASQTCDGVTVTAEAVLGDTSNYTVVFSIRREDGERFEGISENEGGTLNLLFTNGGTFYVDGIRSSGGKSFFFEDDGDDTTIYYVYQGSVETSDDESIIGRTARVELSDLRLTDESGAPAKLLASGTWTFKFKMNYGDESRELEEAQGVEVTYDGVSVTIGCLRVSPLGLTLDLTTDDDVLDVRDLPLAVTFSDGTTLRLDGTTFVGSEWTWGTTKVRLSGFFDRITSVDDIVSVTVGTTVFPV